MGNPVPHFKHLARHPESKHLSCIELSGTERYLIEDAAAFYRALGYSGEIMKSGVLPDEFVWEKYTKHPTVRNHALYQMAVLEYLIKHSSPFMDRYCSQYQGWLDSYADALRTHDGL